MNTNHPIHWHVEQAQRELQRAHTYRHNMLTQGVVTSCAPIKNAQAKLARYINIRNSLMRDAARA